MKKMLALLLAVVMVLCSGRLCIRSQRTTPATEAPG